MSVAPPEEIWSALQSLRTGSSLEEVAKAHKRGKTTVANWKTKYETLKTLDELKLALNPNETRYVQIISKLFSDHWDGHSAEFSWHRNELTRIANELGIEVPSNLGDNIYSIRHGREDLPDSIRNNAPAGKSWLLLPNGKSTYRFVLAARAFLDPDTAKLPIKIPDSTPQLVARYAKSDEQAVLARIRYCRLVDIFLGLASFQLQSHMRTTIAHFNGAQTELDEIYVGVDGNGTQFVVPVQAKSRDERIGAIQVVTDHFVCAEKFPTMVARTLAAKTIEVRSEEGFGQIFTIALIEAAVDKDYNVSKLKEEHFQLVPAAAISDDDLAAYRNRFRRVTV
ncbi:MAG TPA: hypothetical protein VII49_03280 [Rhizomicrobium sp.]